MKERNYNKKAFAYVTTYKEQYGYQQDNNNRTAKDKTMMANIN